MPLSISALFYYPVKSLSGIAVTRAAVGKRGLRQDRAWMVVDEDGRFVTQREEKTMSLVTLNEAKNGAFRLSAPSMPDLVIDEGTCQHPASVVVWRSTCEALLAGGDVAAWLSDYLKRPVDLAYLPKTSVRAVNPAFARAGDEVSFADGYPILVATEASLEHLNSRLPSPVPMNRFRPNVVLSGASAWEEDTWRALEFPALRVRVAKPCARCPIITIDQATAEKGVEPMRELLTFRRDGNDVLFGQNAIPDGEGTLAVGDIVIPRISTSPPI